MMVSASPLVPTPEPASAARRSWAIPHLTAVAVASVTALLFALAARLELLSPGATMMNADVFAQVTLVRDALFAFGVTLPSIAALGHLLLPPATRDSQSGRLENLAIGAHLCGAALLLAATLTSGWAPLQLVAGAGALVCIAGTLQALAFCGRLFAARPASEPTTLFIHALGLTALAELVVLPAATAAFVVLIVEHSSGQLLWHGVGHDASAFEHWLRLYMQPVAYVALVPCLGVVAEIFETRGRATIVAMGALLVFGAVAWGARIFGDDGAGPAAVASFFSLLLLVPSTVLVGHLLATLGGKGAPRWFAVAFTICFAELAATALPLAMADVSPRLQTNAYGAGHHELLLAALGFAVAAALHRAWPQLSGSAYAEAPARLGGALALIGLQLAIVPELLGGLGGQPATIEYPARFHALSIVATVGWATICIGAAIVAGNLMLTLRRDTSTTTAH